MEPMFVIHNISIATDDDIIQFVNDVNKYTVYLSRAIIIWGNCLNWLEKTIVSDHIFCQILVSWFGYLLMATECRSHLAYRWCHMGHTWTTKNVTWVGHAWAKDADTCITPVLPRMFHGWHRDYWTWFKAHTWVAEDVIFGVKPYNLFALMYFT